MIPGDMKIPSCIVFHLAEHVTLLVKSLSTGQTALCTIPKHFMSLLPNCKCTVLIWTSMDYKALVWQHRVCCRISQLTWAGEQIYSVIACLSLSLSLSLCTDVYPHRKHHDNTLLRAGHTGCVSSMCACCDVLLLILASWVLPVLKSSHTGCRSWPIVYTTSYSF